MARLFRLSVLGTAALMVAANDFAVAQQRCPPNSHREAVPFAGSLRTAQCFCDPGFVNLHGACVLPATLPEAPQRNDPARTNAVPKAFR